MRWSDLTEADAEYIRECARDRALVDLARLEPKIADFLRSKGVRLGVPGGVEGYEAGLVAGILTDTR